jgi:molybdate transport system substrate-binding protein
MRAGHPTGRVVRLVLTVAMAVTLAGCAGASAVGPEDPLIVSAASDLMPAFTLIGEAFTERTDIGVTFNFGSSGQIAQQLIEGAPIDVYASANVSFVDLVLREGVGDPDTQATYAFGRIVIWSRDGTWATLEELFADPDVGRVAIANPGHAPYGLAAQEALESVGLWEEVRDRLVFGENVSDTQRLAATGNVDAAIVALSLAIAGDERGEGEWTLVEAELHTPLQQDLVVTATGGRVEAAMAFADFVGGEEGREIMRRFGFLLPGETLAGG